MRARRPPSAARVGAQFAAAVHLLGDVGQVEVGGEGADQLGGGLQVGAAAAARRRPRRRSRVRRADLLDEFEQLGALLADEGLAEQVAQAADVGAQLGCWSVAAVWSSALLTGAAPCSVEARRRVTRRCLGAVLGSRRARSRTALSGGIQDEAERTALSDRLQDRCRARTRSSTGSCRRAARCHTYDAVGYGSVGSLDRAPSVRPGICPAPTTPQGTPMTTSLRCARRRPEDDPTTPTLALRHAGRRDSKRSLEQIALLLFIIVPFLALLAAVPLAWGWGVSWLDLGLLVVMYSSAATASRSASTATSRTAPSRRSGRCGSRSRSSGSMAVEGPLVRWVADHRKHHKFSDAEGDPHSPWRFGETRPGADEGPVVGAHRLDVRRGADAAAQVRAGPDQGPGDPRDLPAVHAVDDACRCCCPPLVGGLVTMSWWGAFTAFFWGSLVRVALLHHVTWSINSICHAVGKRPFKSRDRSGNVWWLAVLSCGESWHNLHHADPTSRPARRDARARSTPAPGIIRWFEKLGLGVRRALAVTLAYRFPSDRTARRKEASPPKRHD